MTPTTTERDRFEAWAKDTMSLVKEPGGYKEATTHHAWRAWQAALTREQREGVQRPSQGWYRARIMESLDHEPCVAGGGWVRFVCSNPERRHPHASDPQGPCPSCVAEGVGNWSCITLAAFAGSQPQREAPGAGCVCGNPEAPYTVHRTDGPCYQPETPGAVAALVATWREDAEKEDARYEESAGFKCGLQYCATDLEFALRSESAATPPAPVDVRVAELIAAAVAWWKAHRPLSFNESQHLSNPTINCPTAAADTLAKAVCGYLLDGPPAGVVIDDAMVRRAVHAYDEWMIEHAPDETDAYHDGMRAALTAALGGGGGVG